MAYSGGRNCSRSGGAAGALMVVVETPAVRFSASISMCKSAISRSSRRAVRRHFDCRSQAAIPPIKKDDQQCEKRQRQRRRRMFGAEWVERHRDNLPVRHGKSDNDDGERHEDDRRDDLAE
jgi:hypothetical protein